MSRAYFFQHIQNEINFANRVALLNGDSVDISHLKSVHGSMQNNISIKNSQVTVTNSQSLRTILMDLQFYTAWLSVHKDSHIDMKEIDQFKNDALELFKQKNTDYGDAFALYGIPGVLMRMGDKFQRIFSLSDNNNGVCVKDETKADTIIDLYNYSIMAIMLIDENKDVIDLNDRNSALLTINASSKDPQKLHQIREYIIEKTHPLSNEIVKNKNLLEIVNQMIINICDHKWVRDYGEYVDSHTPHYCEKCGTTD